MEEMNRTHKEPVWGWVSAVAGLIDRAQRSRVRAEAKALRKPKQVVTPWSPHSPAGWSA